MSTNWHEQVKQMTPYFMKGYETKPIDFVDGPWAAAAAIAYFRSLGNEPITGEQVADFFDALIGKGMVMPDAAYEAKLPDAYWPEFGYED